MGVISAVVGAVVGVIMSLYLVGLALVMVLAGCAWLLWYRFLPAWFHHIGFHLGWCRHCSRFGWVMNDDNLHERCWLEGK